MEFPFWAPDRKECLCPDPRLIIVEDKDRDGLPIYDCECREGYVWNVDKRKCECPNNLREFVPGEDDESGLYYCGCDVGQVINMEL